MEDHPLEVHAKMRKLNFNKFIKIIRENITPEKDRGDYLEPLVNYAMGVAKSGTDRSFFKKFAELKEINNIVKRYLNSNVVVDGKQSLQDTIDFIMQQPDDFKKLYVSNFSFDCMNANPDIVGQHRISCPGGMYERVYLNMEGVLQSLCLENNCPQLYKNLYDCFQFTTKDISSLAGEWYETQDPEKDNFSEMSTEEKQKYIDTKGLEFKKFAVDRIGEREALNAFFPNDFKGIYMNGGKKKRNTIKKRKAIKKRKTIQRKKKIMK
jgi:hypothetical protein